MELQFSNLGMFKRSSNLLSSMELCHSHVTYGTRIKSGEPSVIYDEEIDGIRINQKHIFNLSGETYVNVFKKHKENR